MLIILEGPDCAGKTTFAERIAAAIRHSEPDSDVTLFHRGPPQVHPLDEYVAPLLDYRPETGRHVVCDRWHVGETVYPALFDRHTDMTEDVLLYVEKFLQSRGALLVLCVAEPARLVDCALARDNQRDARTVTSALVSFNRYATSRTQLPVLTVDVSDPDGPDVESAVDHVVALANDNDWHTDHLNPFTTYVGPGQPSLLLFGDRRGPVSTELTHYGQWPAFVPRSSTSGAWLFTTLLVETLRVPAHRLLLNQVGVANACDVDDPYALWSALGKPETVALGVNAHRELRAAGVEYRRVSHPQYYRRFRHNERRAYFDALFNSQEINA